MRHENGTELEQAEKRLAVTIPVESTVRTNDKVYKLIPRKDFT
jgi:hypothetical protein